MKFSSLRFIFLAAIFTLAIASSSRAAPSFTKESGVRLSSAAPQSVVLSSGSVYRMYFIRDYEVLSATSSNQIDWTEEGGVRLSSAAPSLFGVSNPITGCSVLSLNSGAGFRMLYSVGVGAGPFGIMIATSTDGMGFGLSPLEISTAVFISTGGTFVGSPRLTEHSNDWLLFYVQDSNGGNESADKDIYTAQSTDEGISWSTTTLLTSGPVGELALSTRTDQRVRLFYTAPESGDTTNSELVSALSNSGVTSFSAEGGVRLSTDPSDGSLSNPVVIRSSDTSSYRYRVFYNYNLFTATSPADIYSGVTASPDVRSVTPSVLINDSSSNTVVISGEIFSPTPTVQLTQSGQTPIPGTNVSRTSDQSITADFDVSGAQIGTWALVVTNDDLVEGTLASGIVVTFRDATVSISDSLLRPRLGTVSQISITIFNPGRVKVRLYTMDGHFIKMLHDQDENAGPPIVVPWDGTNSEGTTVASGTYLLTFEGPKLNMKKKIVVIR